MSLPPRASGRTCGGCGGDLRPSHRTYVGGGRQATVLRCAGCGTQYLGAERDAAADAQRNARAADERRAASAKRRAAAGSGAAAGATAAAPARGRRALAEGAPENPVLDADTASALLDLLGDPGAPRPT